MIKPQDVLEKNAAIQVADVSGVTMILNSTKTDVLGLNEMGDYIFKLFSQNPLKVEELVSYLSLTFSIDSSKCLREISPFLENMIREKILFVNQGNSSSHLFPEKKQRTRSKFESLDWEVPRLKS